MPRDLRTFPRFSNSSRYFTHWGWGELLMRLWRPTLANEGPPHVRALDSDPFSRSA